MHDGVKSEPESESELEDMFVDVSGTRVHCLHAGSGRPLVLIHGLVGSTENWRGNIGALAPHASVYAIDLVNMGKSQRIAGLDAGLEATADRVAECMDALGLAQADIAGHSHGGSVALLLAARHPDRVRTLILFAPANPFSAMADSLVRLYSSPLGGLMASWASYLPAPMQLVALGRMFGDPARIPDGCLEGYVDGLRVPGTVGHVVRILRAWFKDMAKLKAALPWVAAVPTLLLWGDCDCAVDPASAVRLQRALPRSELRILRGGGHILFEEMPQESNRLMLDWLRREQPSRQTAACASTSSARLGGRSHHTPIAARQKSTAALPHLT